MSPSSSPGAFTVFQPGNPDEAAALLADRTRTGQPLAIVDRIPEPGELRRDLLSVRQWRNQRFFHPADMVVGVDSGLPMAELHRLLAEQGMRLPVGCWFAGDSVGAVAAANRFGPERLMRGGLRDSLIGMEYLTPTGECVRVGGKVVKNVTGYDLGRMMLGNRGGLCLMTGLNFKVMPAPVQPHGLFLSAPDSSWRAGVAAAHAARLPLDWLQAVWRDGGWLVGIGISGNAARRGRLVTELRSMFGQPLTLFADGREEAPFDVFAPEHRLCGFLSPHIPLDRLSLHVHGLFPTRTFLESVDLDGLAAPGDILVVHPIGGDFHLLAPSDSAAERQVSQLRDRFSEERGSLVFERVPTALRERWGRVDPLPPERILMNRLKRQLDPAGILVSSFFD